MTSVVDTSVKHFHNDMFAAPVLNGLAGSLISLLDACLVNGFDLKSATSLVVSGGAATLAYSGSYSATVDSVILVSGSSVAALNGEQRVTEIGAGVVKFATAAADGTASGTITFKMAPMGWIKPFSGTNLAAYKSADPESTGMYLRIDDTSPTVARVVGYEAMTGISTGTGPFPTADQMSGGGYWHKNTTGNANPMQWALVGDGRTFYIHISTQSASGVGFEGRTIGSLRGFGDMIALRPSGDAYACTLSYSNSADASSFPNYGSFDHGNLPLMALPRNFTGLGSATLEYSIPYTGSSTTASGKDSHLGNFPSPIDGSLRLSRRYIAANTTSAPRCDVPGIYSIPQNRVADSFSNKATVAGTGALAGRTLFGVTTATTSANNLPTGDTAGLCLLDITGPWR